MPTRPPEPWPTSSNWPDTTSTTGGSQFFICHNRENTQHLDGRHTCFGQVVEGLDVIDDIRPGDKILSIRIVEE